MRRRGFFWGKVLGTLVLALLLTGAGPVREGEAAVSGEAQPDFYRMGIACWSLVGAGMMGVAAAALAGERPKSGRLLVPAAVEGQQPVKLDHSPRYTPPPHRQNYRSSQRRW